MSDETLELCIECGNDAEENSPLCDACQAERQADANYAGRRRIAAAKWAADFAALSVKLNRAEKALAVFCLDPNLRDHLATNDPMSLAQAQRVLSEGRMVWSDYGDYLRK